MSLSVKVHNLVTFPEFSTSVWPHGTDRFSRLAFSDDGCWGAFLIHKSEAAIFKIVKENGEIRADSIQKVPTSRQPILSMAFGPKRGGPRPGRPESFDSEPEKDPYFDPDANYFALGLVSGEITVRDTSGNLLTRLTSHAGSITALAFTPRTYGVVQLLSIATDGALKVWDFESPLLYNMCCTKEHFHPLQCLSWSKNGKLVATAGKGNTAYIYRMYHKVGERIQHLNEHISGIVACEFSPDSSTLITASLDTRLHFWDVVTGALLQTIYHNYPIEHFLSESSQVRAACIVMFGSHVVTVTHDKVMRIWDLERNSMELDRSVPEYMAEFEGGDGSNSICACKNGQWVAISSLHLGSVTLYEIQVPVPSLAEISRAKVREYLTLNQVKAEKLPLPKTLKYFVDFETKNLMNHYREMSLLST